MFTITQGKGFHIAFANGWTVSVQFGKGNYCDHHGMIGGDLSELAAGPSKTAEVGVWNVNSPKPMKVRGYLSPEEVAKVLAAVARRHPL